nr:hypothetical protein [Kibdelosporangium sp. MJ126-NF4]CTQ98121.1 hypothetical protein [Kibdelosporangium sp. MJ126-NF4]
MPQRQTRAKVSADQLSTRFAPLTRALAAARTHMRRAT